MIFFSKKVYVCVCVCEGKGRSVCWEKRGWCGGVYGLR